MGHSITISDVSFAFQPKHQAEPVLRDLSFTVEEDEFLVVLGPSGCGKTTLLKTIAGLVDPTSGWITVDGDPVDGPRSDISMVFQEFVLLPWKSVLENVALGLTVQHGYGAKRRIAIAKEWIERVGLSDMIDAYPSDLSGGMKQRVGLARALATDPAVLLMDEPFGALDAQTKDRMQSELLQLWDGDKTVIFVTHDIDEALLLGDRVVVLSHRPSRILRCVPVNFDRPRSDRRREIETSRRYGALKQELRAELGLLTT